jgi:hypothetical protein
MANDLLHDEKAIDLLVDSIQQELRGDEESLFFSLGVGLVYWNAPENVSYSAPYEKIGRELWVAIHYEMYRVLCDERDATPTEWVAELISGDVRNLIVGIVSAITANFDVSAGIAIPAVALVLKTGITSFCKTKPDEPPACTLQQILTENKEQARHRDSRNIDG